MIENETEVTQVIKTNKYLVGSIAPDDYRKALRISELLYGHKDEITLELEELVKGQKEGHYNNETMTWDDETGKHSQRCNANKMLDGGSSSALPDGGGGY